MDAFILFPFDLYSNISNLKNHKVFLIEHPKFFDRYKDPIYPKLKLNILKPVYHRVTMQKYYVYLKSRKIDVKYVTFKENWIKIIKKHSKFIKLYDPVDREIEDQLESNFDYDSYELLDTPRFIIEYSDLEEYADLTSSNKIIRQTSFYGHFRKKYNILMKNSKPVGNKLTYDTQNRKPPSSQMIKELESKSEPDYSSNKEVKSAVKYVVSNIPESHLTIFEGSYSDLKSNKFDLNSIGYELKFPIDHNTSNSILNNFIKYKLNNFGIYQDAMLDLDNSMLYHSGISPMLNIGLLTPIQVLKAVIKKLTKSKSNINSVEGFVRQVLGWREFCRFTYMFKSNLFKSNFFSAKSKLDSKFYTATTNIYPVDDCISKAFRYGYLHHIERLMIVSNYMTLKSIHPKQMFKWFTEFSLDSYDWVMEFNIYVMASYADGGHFTSKPYISSSNYILKMSNYAKNDWSEKWDKLFWGFLLKHKSKIKKINRLSMLLKHAKSRVP